MQPSIEARSFINIVSIGSLIPYVRTISNLRIGLTHIFFSNNIDVLKSLQFIKAILHKYIYVHSHLSEIIYFIQACVPHNFSVEM